MIRGIIGRIRKKYKAQHTPEQQAAPQATGNFRYINTDEYHILPKSAVTYHYDQLYTLHNCDFINNEKFARAYALGKATDFDGSVLSNTEIYWRIHVLCWAASQVRHLNGDFVDCGVNTGIFARAIIDYIDFGGTGKTYYLMDTFEGLDKRYSTPEEWNRAMNGVYMANGNDMYKRVQQTFEGHNVKIIKGPIPETLGLVDTESVAYLSIDMNCVQPEVDALNFFWDKLLPGGIILLDDYGYCNAYMNQKKAHDAFAASKGVEILTLPTCQGIIMKPYK